LHVQGERVPARPGVQACGRAAGRRGERAVCRQGLQTSIAVSGGISTHDVRAALRACSVLRTGMSPSCGAAGTRRTTAPRRAARARPHARLSRFYRAERSRARPGSRAGRDVAHAAAFLSCACFPCDECGAVTHTDLARLTRGPVCLPRRQVLPFKDKEDVTCRKPAGRTWRSAPET
jgi:hypothetical protein